jgi:hypothetical protein
MCYPFGQAPEVLGSENDATSSRSSAARPLGRAQQPREALPYWLSVCDLRAGAVTSFPLLH